MVPEPALEPSQLFLVRVWTQAPGFRASVRAVDEAEPRWFTTPAELARFLAAAQVDTGASEPRPDAGEHDEPNR